MSALKRGYVVKTLALFALLLFDIVLNDVIDHLEASNATIFATTYVSFVCAQILKTLALRLGCSSSRDSLLCSWCWC
jgi:hypothetical protein